MESANVGLARSIFRAWERGDYGSVDWADPEIELVFVGELFPGTWRGLDGLLEGWREFLSNWDGFRVEAEDYLDVDPGRLLVYTRYGGRGKTSGVDVGMAGARGANLLDIRDGRVTRLALYMDRDRARTDAGLEPEA